MKRVLITAGEDIIIRNILCSDFFPTFRGLHKGDIVIAVHRNRVSYTLFPHHAARMAARGGVPVRLTHPVGENAFVVVYEGD